MNLKKIEKEYLSFLDILNDDDDVQNVYTNVRFNKQMFIIGIDPGISGAICFFENGKVIDVIEMPSMSEGKKNKKQVNGNQLFNEFKNHDCMK